ncbi:hypothetical protein [Cryobacterium cryoconiti]|uniref:Uncharacterized protein n=1 Tax=Cryobacterium cryoconiti TaxID=1259239 RepID=A0A4Y8JUG5_9MICO|nr:hypothetical protein [Cryobacterium cryoconiti]TFD27551.1 hypothetical protein E3T49_13500 [Cryobacterium cryoconiti]
MGLRNRRGPATGRTASGAGALGVGAQVVVRLDRVRYPDATAEDPSGVIVAAGELDGAALYAPVSGREAVWVVQFDEPFFGLDGSGPHASARVAQSSLEAAPEA